MIIISDNKYFLDKLFSTNFVYFFMETFINNVIN